jgi:hypothetical protein
MASRRVRASLLLGGAGATVFLVVPAASAHDITPVTSTAPTGVLRLAPEHTSRADVLALYAAKIAGLKQAVAAIDAKTDALTAAGADGTLSFRQHVKAKRLARLSGYLAAAIARIPDAGTLAPSATQKATLATLTARLAALKAELVRLAKLAIQSTVVATTKPSRPAAVRTTKTAGMLAAFADRFNADGRCDHRGFDGTRYDGTRFDGRRYDGWSRYDWWRARYHR